MSPYTGCDCWLKDTFGRNTTFLLLLGSTKRTPRGTEPVASSTTLKVAEETEAGSIGVLKYTAMSPLTEMSLYEQVT